MKCRIFVKLLKIFPLYDTLTAITFVSTERAAGLSISRACMLISFIFIPASLQGCLKTDKEALEGPAVATLASVLAVEGKIPCVAL